MNGKVQAPDRFFKKWNLWLLDVQISAVTLGKGFIITLEKSNWHHKVLYANYNFSIFQFL
jgi:hypothetical protein